MKPIRRDNTTSQHGELCCPNGELRGTKLSFENLELFLTVVLNLHLVLLCSFIILRNPNTTGVIMHL